MEKCLSWAANTSSASHYHLNNSPQHVPILSHINPAHSPSHFLSTHFNIILPSTPRPSKWSVSPHVFLPKLLLSPTRATCPVHLILVLRLSPCCWRRIFSFGYYPGVWNTSWFDHPNIWRVQIKKNVAHYIIFSIHVYFVPLRPYTCWRKCSRLLPIIHNMYWCVVHSLMLCTQVKPSMLVLVYHTVISSLGVPHSH
jgi:hypothetical protein